MNVPAVVQRTFEETRSNPELAAIVNQALEDLSKLPTPEIRAEYVHTYVDAYNLEYFSHPLVKQLSPCKMGCSACCHTQVSITEDEAMVLVEKINQGLVVDLDRLKLQMVPQEDSDSFFKISFEDRKCIFLDDQGACKVYADRPSVCRTNVVLGDPAQCDTTDKIQSQRLVKTPRSNLIIYAAFLFSKQNGTLPQLIGKLLGL